MDKLSERLWVMRVSLPDLEDSELATLDDAIKQIERYEDAPVVRVGGADGLSCFIERQGKKRLPDMQGQRVRILLDTEGV